MFSAMKNNIFLFKKKWDTALPVILFFLFRYLFIWNEIFHYCVFSDYCVSDPAAKEFFNKGRMRACFGDVSSVYPGIFCDLKYTPVYHIEFCSTLSSRLSPDDTV